MRLGSPWLTGLLLVVFCISLFADPVCRPINDTPKILGREIERFVLLRPIDIDRTGPGMTRGDEMLRMRCRVLPGQFIPVSEDDAWVYYQAGSGLQRIFSRTASPGGIMVSKTKPDVIFVYLGNARAAREPLERDSSKLSRIELSKLQIGSAGR